MSSKPIVTKAFRVPSLPNLLAITLAWPITALAQAPEPLPSSLEKTPVLSSSEAYQRDLIRATEGTRGLSREPHPEGKTIERVLIVPYDVILQEDPWPGFLNLFHGTTQDDIIRQELLFKEGERWNADRIEESARVLRRDLFLSVAEIVAARGSSKDKVVVLVVTKDLWSLRLNNDFSYVNGTLESLDLELTEQNLFGRMKAPAAHFRLDQASYLLGQEYNDPRILGSRISGQESAALIWNRDTRKLEGGVGGISFTQPLYNLDTRWAWIASANYRTDIYRLFSGANLATAYIASTGQYVPYAFDRRLANFQAGLTRSFGHDTKQNVSFGWRAVIREFGAPIGAPSRASLQAFQSQYSPRSERSGMLYASYRTYQAQYTTLMDINTFALTEDFRVGLDLSAEVRYANPAFGFNSTYLETLGSAAYTWIFSPSDDILTINGTGSARRQPGTLASSDFVNETVSAGARNISPPIGPFRLHTAAGLTRRYNNIDRAFDVLGGDTSLRGFPSAYLVGPDIWTANAEVRTLAAPLLQSVYVGGAVFFDSASTFADSQSSGVYKSMGFGLRALFPQFNRSVLRADVGFPLQAPAGVDSVNVVAKFGQAF